VIFIVTYHWYIWHKLLSFFKITSTASVDLRGFEPGTHQLWVNHIHTELRVTLRFL